MSGEMKETVIRTLRTFDPGLRNVIDQAYRDTGLDEYEREYNRQSE